MALFNQGATPLLAALGQQEQQGVQNMQAGSKGGIGRSGWLGLNMMGDGQTAQGLTGMLAGQGGMGAAFGGTGGNPWEAFIAGGQQAAQTAAEVTDQAGMPGQESTYEQDKVAWESRLRKARQGQRTGQVMGQAGFIW